MFRWEAQAQPDKAKAGKKILKTPVDNNISLIVSHEYQVFPGYFIL